MRMTTLFRKRLIPDECVSLKDDIIIHQDDSHIITSWKTFHPKAEFSQIGRASCRERV